MIILNILHEMIKIFTKDIIIREIILGHENTSSAHAWVNWRCRFAIS